ncbi:hypothetical protein [Halostella pelagica]|uniref:hypothetical protein n=1 Tax=Halostella pelagica TaxID=2583824 RepID=UPI0010815BBC|nr:hypothetical protein [Halostella pelagica]
MVEFRIHHSARVARTELTRHQREFDGRWFGRRVRSGLLLCVGVLLGAFAYRLGRDLATGQTALPAGLWTAVTALFVWMVWRSSSLTHARFERLNADLLLTTVPARTVTSGLLLFGYARLITVLALPALGIAVGTALGLRSPMVALTVVAAVASLTALAVAVGTAGRLAAHLVGLRIVRLGFYKDLFTVFGWTILLVVFIIFQDTLATVVPAIAVSELRPAAWVIDLALSGASHQAGVAVRRGLSALGVVLLSVPLLAGVTTVLARRIWEADPASSTEDRGSHSLVDDWWLERFLGERVSRPVRTVARGRLLVERRVPRGVLNTGYVLVFAALVLFPAVAIVGGANTMLLLVAFSLGLAGGVAFGTDPIGVKYRVLPALLTTVGGRQFVDGLVLAALVAGVPVVTVVVLPLGVVGPVGVVEAVLMVLVGVAVCACSAAVCVAVGMGVDRTEFVPIPFFFTDVPVYAEIGSAPFLRLGGIFVVVLIAALPGFLGNIPSVYGGASALGVPAVAVRTGSLCLTVLVAVGLSVFARRIAVRRYREYRIR